MEIRTLPATFGLLITDMAIDILPMMLGLLTRHILLQAVT